MNFNVTPIYKNREKRIFVFCVHLDPPHWPSNFENHHYRVKNQNCRRPLEWPIKTSAREALGQWKKLELNRTYQFGEKSQKPSKNTLIYIVVFSGGFWDFSTFKKSSMFSRLLICKKENSQKTIIRINNGLFSTLTLIAECNFWDTGTSQLHATHLSG